MTKPITGQYEYTHSSGVGLDYFTSRVDRIILQTNGQFIYIVQERSRLANAAQSLMSGQQVATNAPEIRREGSYTTQGNVITFHFDDGTQDQGQLAWNGGGIQFGPNFFNKVSDSTLLPPTNRLKKDMDDIAKGLKIASTIGGMAVKAAKTIHDTMQSTLPSRPTSAVGAVGATGAAISCSRPASAIATTCVHNACPACAKYSYASYSERPGNIVLRSMWCTRAARQTLLQQLWSPAAVAHYFTKSFFKHS